jgi:SAM-dependent methyltransferase
MIYQHPLAYLLGLEGVALLHAFAGDYDRDFTQARLAEIRALLDSAAQLGNGAEVPPIPIVEGYRAWAEAYDQPGNQLIDLEQPIVWEILDPLPCGTALDAACGTGRHAEHLAALGHKVIGVGLKVFPTGGAPRDRGCNLVDNSTSGTGSEALDPARELT